MFMWRKVARFLIIVLILVNLSIIEMSMLPTRVVTADTTLESDMPVIFVDPQNVSASLGETFTISVKIFNLSNRFYPTDEEWIPGNELGPPGLRFNYSLGNLYSFDVNFTWDPTLLEYKSHTVMVPRGQDYPNGTLYPPIYEVPDTLDKTKGIFRVRRTSQHPAEAFNSPRSNATVFTMTFTVKDIGACGLNLDFVDLIIPAGQPRFEDAYVRIPHWVKHGEFRTPVVATRIASVKAGTLVEGELYAPLISGENATVLITMRNDGNVTDTYNVTLYKETVPFATWNNETLEPSKSNIFNYTINREDLSVGNNVVVAKATVLHGSDMLTFEVSENFTVILPPTLEINGPSSATAGETISFSASGSSHGDPNGQILNYTWTLWAPGETLPRETLSNGDEVDFDLLRGWEGGNYTVMLVVKDNYGIEYDENRPATSAYRKTVILQIAPASAPSFFIIENIVLVVIVIVIIALAAVYLYRRSR